MHTDEYLTKNFISKKGHLHPIWYYKKLEFVSISYVIMNLLKEHFVVEINNYKYEVAFGVNKFDEIGFGIKYDEFNNDFISSHEILNKGFKEGKWFIITDNSTSNKFKEDYNLELKKYNEEQKIQFDKEILTNCLKTQKNITEEEKKKFIEYINNCSNEKREFFIKELFKNMK